MPFSGHTANELKKVICNRSHSFLEGYTRKGQRLQSYIGLQLHREQPVGEIKINAREFRGPLFRCLFRADEEFSIFSGSRLCSAFPIWIARRLRREELNLLCCSNEINHHRIFAGLNLGPDERLDRERSRSEEEHVLSGRFPLMSFFFFQLLTAQTCIQLSENLYESGSIAHLSIKHLIKWYFCISFSHMPLELPFSFARLTAHILKAVGFKRQQNIMWPYHTRKIGQIECSAECFTFAKEMSLTATPEAVLELIKKSSWEIFC